MNIKKKLLFMFFLSGACGLIYQVLWVRMLGLIFGNTIYAVSTILAGFMAGLALGSWYFGRKADQMENEKLKMKNFQSPLNLFTFLILGIGVYGALTPLLFGMIRQIYVLFGITEITAGSTMLVFILGFAVILFPTFLMGGTLPVLAGWLEQELKIKDDPEKIKDFPGLSPRNFSEIPEGKLKIGYSVGILYSVNTWGAVMGAFLTGYVLIMILGVRGTLYLASAANVVIAGIVFMLSKNVAADFSLRNNEERNLKVAATTDNPRLSEGRGGAAPPLRVALQKNTLF